MSYMLGLTFLKGNKFDPNTVMPICLPTSSRFKDTERLVTAVGMGLTKYKEVRCDERETGSLKFRDCDLAMTAFLCHTHTNPLIHWTCNEPVWVEVLAVET